MGVDAERIAESFIDLADTLASDYDIVDYLHSLVERCQDNLQVDAGGVLLEAEDGQLRLVAATTDAMREYEEAEIRDNEGPGMDAYRRVEQVFAVDLNDERERWPTVSATALGLGLQAVYAFPIRLREDCIGALNLYREQPGPFSDADIRLAQAFDRMRREARSRRMRLQEVAARVVARTTEETG